VWPDSKEEVVASTRKDEAEIAAAPVWSTLLEAALLLVALVLQRRLAMVSQH